MPNLSDEQRHLLKSLTINPHVMAKTLLPAVLASQRKRLSSSQLLGVRSEPCEHCAQPMHQCACETGE